MSQANFDSNKTALVIRSRTEIVFIEDNIADYRLMAATLGVDKEVVILDSTRDGLEQIASVLAGRSGIDAVHIISHGSAGSANLGASSLNQGSIWAHSQELHAIGHSLAPGADILLYGCDIGAGAQGAALVQQLALATGADVAASDDLTGSAALGGDWVLEVRQGDIDAAPAVGSELAQHYAQVLNITTATVNFGTDGNFVSKGLANDPGTDPVYNVNGDPAYQLLIDGKDKGVYSYAGNVTIAEAGNETLTTLSFVGGQLFTIGSLDMSSYAHVDQYMVFKGYNASGGLVGTKGVQFIGNNYAFKTISLNMAGIQTLKITSTAGSTPTTYTYLVMDNLQLSAIAPAPPKVVAVTSATTVASYKAGDTVAIQVEFDTAVDVTGTPQLTLETGTSDRVASYVSGTGGKTLTFNYTVQTGDVNSSLDYLSTSALSANGGSIKLKSGTTDASLALPSPGAAGSLSVNTDIVVDGVAPTVTVSADGTPLLVGQTKTVYFTFSEDPNGSFAWNGSSGDVSVSGGTLSAITGSGTTYTATFTPTANVDGGSASISVKAASFTDVAGNSNAAASTPLTISYDTKAPATPATPAMAAASDTGSSNSDAVTNKNKPAFAGAAGSVEASATVTVYIDGSSVGTTTAAGDGSWSFTTPSALSDGSHSVTARATDAAGNASSQSSALAIKIDTTTPNNMVASIGLSADTGTSSSDFITKTAAQTISGVLGSNLATDEHVEVSLDNGSTWNTATASVGSKSWSYAGTLASSGTLKVRVVDLAGNAGTSMSQAYTLDTNAPAAPSTPGLAASSDTGQSSSDNLTSATTPTFTGTAEANATIKLYDTDGTTEVGSAAADGAGNWSITASTLGEGSHTVTAKATDTAGNVSAASSGQTITIDLTAPGTTATSAAFSADTGLSTSDFVTKTAAQTITGKLSANLAAGEYVQVSLDNGAHWNTATSSVGTDTWSYGATLTASGTLKVRVLDAVDNAGTEWSQGYTFDQTAPTVTISAAKSSLKIGETTTITFTFSEDPGTSFDASKITVSGGTLTGLSTTGASRTATFTPDADTNGGVASITIAAGGYTDAAGNDGAGGATPSLTFDTKAPDAPSALDLATASDSGTSSSDNLTNVTTPTITGTAEAGATVKLYDGVTQVGSGTADGSGNWSITTSALAGGDHVLTAKATDAATNTGAASAALTVTVDTTKPTLAITVDPATLHIGQTSNVTFTFSEDPGTSFDASSIVVSGGTLSDLSTSGAVRTAVFTPTANTNGGAGSISVATNKYTDAAGNNGAANASATLAYDTLAPAASSTPALTAGSDTGSSSTDKITADTTPTFTGTAEANATIKLYDTDGTTELGSATADGSGNWSVTSSDLAEGNHTVTTKVTDAAGNTGSASAGLTFTIDLTAPTTTVTSGAFSADTGLSATDFVTKTAAQTISGKLSANLAAGEYVQVSLDNGAHWNTATSSVGADTWSYGATLSASGTLKVRVMDAVDNAGTEWSQDYTFDQTAPTVTISAAKPSLKIGETTTITFTFSEDPGTSFDATKITVSGGTLTGLSTTGASRTATFTPDADTNGGVASITIAAGGYTDAAGNDGAGGATPSLTFDTKAPDAPSALDLATASDSGTSSSDNLTNVTTPTITGTAEAGATVKLYDGATQVGSGTADGSGNWSITTSALSGGDHVLTAKATDAATNTGAASAALTVTVDTTKPTLAIAVDPATLHIGQTANVTFTFSEDPGTSFDASSIVVSGGTLSGLSTSGTVRTAVFTPTANTNGGVGSISVATNKFTDAAGNNGAANASATLAYDTLAPGASSTPALTAGSDTGSSSTDKITAATTPTFTGTAEANATVKLYEGATEIGSGTADGSGNWSITSSSLAEGDHTVTTKVTDAAGNTSSASAGLTFTIDLTAPGTTVTSAALSADTGLSPTDFVTRTAAQTISGKLSANLAAGEYVQVSLDNGAHWNTATSSVGADTWSYGATLTASGTLKVRVMDGVDNAGPEWSQDYTFDQTSPTVTISAARSSLKIGETTTITFAFSEDPGTSFDASKITVAGGTLTGLTTTGASRTATFTPTDNTNGGVASITITAGGYTDAAGNGGAAGLTPSLTFDTKAPNAPSTPDLATASDSGTSSSDNLTNVATPTFTGTAEAGATVKLYDGATQVGSGTADGSGNWSITTSALSGGQHQISATASDASTNTGVASSALTVTVDTTKPTLAIAVDPATLHIGQTSNVTFTFSEDPGTSFDASSIVVSGGTLSGLSTSGTVRTAVFTPNANTNGGAGSISVTANKYTDAAGNSGAADTTTTLSYDTLAPGASSAPALVPSSDTGISSTDRITADTTPTFSGTAEANATVRLYEGATEIGSATADGTGKWAITSSLLADGSHTVNATVTDVAGNTGPASAGLTFRINTHAAAPGKPVLHPGSDSAAAGDGLTKVAAPIVTGAGADAGATVTLYDTDGSTVLGTTTAAPDGTWSITSSTLADGQHTLVARQTDLAGNVSSAGAALLLTVDTIAPAAPGTPVLDAASDSGAPGDRITRVNTPVISGTAAAFAQVTVYDTDGSTVLGATQAGANGAWSIVSARLSDGEHALTVTQADDAGNVSAASQALNLTIDTAAPAAPAAPGLSAASDSGTVGDGVTNIRPVILEGMALANAKVVLYDGAAEIGTALADATGKWTMIVRTLAEGNHQLTLTQADAAGNISAASAVFALKLVAPPPPPVPSGPPSGVVDGVPVEVKPAPLPGGGTGVVVSVPVVTPDRTETSGKPTVADIPLATDKGDNLLVAQLPPGFGLSASGGANAPAASTSEQLIAAIKAATSDHPADDQGHLTGNGQSFLDKLPATQSLLVETVTPVAAGSTAPAGTLTLNGSANAGQHVALVIDTSKLPGGSTLQLQNVDFAALIGSVNVVSDGKSLLSGDAASQHFTVATGGSGAIFAGGGDDGFVWGMPQLQTGANVRADVVPGHGQALLHGGLGADTATFNGNRASFNIEFHNGYQVVSSKAEPDAKALVVNVEQLKFADATVAIAAGDDLTTIAGLYESIYGRQADLYGFEFWADAHQKYGMSWGKMAMMMITQGEWNAHHEALNGSTAHDVEVLYEALFSRKGDAAGLEFWTGVMQQHGLSLEQVADYMVQSPEMNGHHRAVADWDFLV